MTDEHTPGGGSTTPGRSGPEPQGSQSPTWHGSEPSGPPNGADRPEGGPAYPPAPAPKRTRPKHTALIAGGIAVLLVLVGVGAWFVSGNLGARTTGQSASQDADTRWPAGEPPVQQANGAAPDWTATADAVQPSVVSITVGAGNRGAGQGSGVILDSEGHIVTNHHVVAGAGRGGSILVTLDDKRTYEASVVGSDPTTDLAVLAIASPPQDLRPISMGNSDTLEVGAPVMAVGNPLGLSGTVTNGIISAVNRPVSTQQQSTDPTQAQGETVVTNAIQTDAAINPGNSGGALVNPSGQLVGINSSIAQTSQQSGNIGIGFSIPVNEVRSVSQQIIETGSVRHPFLGVIGDDGFVQEGNARRASAVVQRVTPDSPADRAGLRPRDAVVALDGEVVDSWLSLVAQVRERDVGQQITLTIVRDGQRTDVQATLAERPSD